MRQQLSSSSKSSSIKSSNSTTTSINSDKENETNFWLANTRTFDETFINGRSVRIDYSFDEIPLPLNVSRHTLYLDLSKQFLTHLPVWLKNFKNLEHLELSGNFLILSEHDTLILAEICKNLKVLNLSKNNISNRGLVDNKHVKFLFQEKFSKLENLDLSSNSIENFENVCYCESLTKLQLSGNEITNLPNSLVKLQNLTILYLGYNSLSQIAPHIYYLKNLTLLALNNNKLTTLPSQFCNLTKLRTLHLHNNQILTLPRIVVDGLPNLLELSLRNNPLIDKFVRKRVTEGRTHAPPTLFELACRAIKMNDIKYTSEDLTPNMIEYLDNAHKCPNINCPGIYFDSKYVQVKFVDTCGAYRLPLLQYLCSPNCFERSEPVTSAWSGTSSNSSNEFSITNESNLDESFSSNNSSDNEDNDFNEELLHITRRVVLSGVEF